MTCGCSRPDPTVVRPRKYLDGLLTGVDQPCPVNPIRMVDVELEDSVTTGSARRQHLAYPLRRNLKVSQVPIKLVRGLRSPACQIGNQDVVAEMQLGFMENRPTTRPSSPELERRREKTANPTRASDVSRGRARLQVELARDQLGDLMLGGVQHILVGGARFLCPTHATTVACYGWVPVRFPVCVSAAHGMRRPQSGKWLKTRKSSMIPRSVSLFTRRKSLVRIQLCP